LSFCLDTKEPKNQGCLQIGYKLQHTENSILQFDNDLLLLKTDQGIALNLTKHNRADQTGGTSQHFGPTGRWVAPSKARVPEVKRRAVLFCLDFFGSFFHQWKK